MDRSERGNEIFGIFSYDKVSPQLRINANNDNKRKTMNHEDYKVCRTIRC